MRDRSSFRPSSGPMLHAALATLGATALHHVYGGIVYATPWRVHGAGVAVVVGIVLIAVARSYVRVQHATHARIAGVTLAVLVLAMPVAATGLFEGVYNHLAKNVLYFAGLPRGVLATLFPPPTYELPNDVVFELSGIAQIIPAWFAARAALRFMRAPRACHRQRCNTNVGLRCLTSIRGEPVEVPDGARLVHLQFRRFAGCPVCNLHLRSFVRRYDAIDAAGVREVVVFHSPADELRDHAGDLPFAVIADPDKRLYAEFGVGSAQRALLDPRAWGPILLAVVRSIIAVVRGRERTPSLDPHGGRFGLPADFLIDRDGRVVACKHGEHVYDQWSVDELLAIAGSVEDARAPRRHSR